MLPLALAGAAVLGVGVVFKDRGSQLQALGGAAIRRLSGPAPTPGPSLPPAHVSLRVLTGAALRPISPLIYGIAVSGAEQLAATGARLNRWGGNPNTRYNWAHGSAWNSARDYEFRNYGGAATQPSSAADAFVAANRALGVQSMLTVPAIGWVARNGDTNTRSTDVPAGGGPPLAGNPEAIAGYDPANNRMATSVRSLARRSSDNAAPGTVYQADWIDHLVQQFGRADAGGVGWYVVDNEPDLWSSTHTDVHPVEPGYDDVLATFIEYATVIKDRDPSAQVLGPALSGWSAYFYSARDRGPDNFRTHADRRAHGDVAFLPWWLAQVRQHDQRIGRRTLDALDVHYYPQSAGVYAGATDAATNALRLRSTRSLWDASYVDESWIGEPVMLLPRLRRWIDENYPGTRLAIDEWNWGADKTLNGALAIANVLGIFGREGVDMAAYWVAPPAGSPGVFAFALYTNYDGEGNGFGDQALAASSDHADDVTVFASRDSSTDDLLVVMVNQRQDADLSVTLELDGPAVVNSAWPYRYSAKRPDAVEQLPSIGVSNSSIPITLPSASITLMRLTQALNVNSTTE